MKSSITDWIGDDDEDLEYYGGDRRRERGGRRRKKKQKEDIRDFSRPNWDAPYDFMRPTTFEEFKGSDEWLQDLVEWKQKLRVHRKRRQESTDSEDNERDRYNGKLLDVADIQLMLIVV